MIYHFCQGCDQRKAEVLFVGTVCTQCIKTSEGMPSHKEVAFTDEEYEEMGNM